MSPLATLGIVFVVLTVMGVPLFVSVGLTTALALYLIDIPYTLMAQTGYGSLTPFPLLTIPLFVLAGRLMEVGGMANRMIAIATNLVGAYRGSMGLVTVFACMLFAALSGSGPATTAAIGSVTVPAMKRDGYDVPFAAAITASAGALGSLIPPSNLLIIYGLVSETSIPRLFLAGVIPGFLVTIFLMITTYVIARRRGYGGDGDPFSWQPFLRAAWDGKWAIGAPVLILGGIYGGAFTPTEAAGVAVFYALFVGLFVYRELTVRKIVEALRFTALLTGILILLHRRGHVVERRELAEGERRGQQDQDPGQKRGKPQGLDDLAHGQFAVDEQPDEQRIEHRHARGFGRGESAAIDAA